MTAPSVFISYSQDSDDHKDRILALANRLRSDGINVTLDQYESSPPEGWPKWMDWHIAKDNYILTVCTETYYRRVMGEEEDGKGLGVKWESTLTYQHIYDNDSLNTRFIPILFPDCKIKHIPTPLKGATYYFLPYDYEKLYRHLTNQPETVKPDLGNLKFLPPRERGHDYLVDLVKKVKRLTQSGSFNEAYEICRNTLLNVPNHPALNLLGAVALIKGKGSDRLQESLIPKIEGHLQIACNSLTTRPTSLALWAILKYDRYVVNGLQEGTPTLSEIKSQLQMADLSQVDLTIVNLIRASDGALAVLGLR